MRISLNPFASKARPVLAGTLGAISAAHPLAVSAGQEMLAADGNAVDATIAAQAVLSVVAPDACGLGGDAFYLVRDASGRVTAINGAGAAARGATAATTNGGASVTVPGMVSAWGTLAADWSRLPLARSLQPALRLARSGVRVDAHVLGAMRTHRVRLLSGGAESWALLALREGEPWVQTELAASLDTIATRGVTAFYSGEIARAIASAVQSHGGALGIDDLAGHETEVTKPIIVPWRGLSVSVQPPASQGVLLALVLVNLARLGEIPAESFDHAAVELTKAAFDLRDRSGEGEALLREQLDLRSASRLQPRRTAKLPPHGRGLGCGSERYGGDVAGQRVRRFRVRRVRS